MATKFRTAEDILRGLHAGLFRELETARSLSAAIGNPRLPEANRNELREMLDDTEELGAALAALDVALEELAKPLPPVRDELRG